MQFFFCVSTHWASLFTQSDQLLLDLLNFLMSKLSELATFEWSLLEAMVMKPFKNNWSDRSIKYPLSPLFFLDMLQSFCVKIIGNLMGITWEKLGDGMGEVSR